MAACESGHLVFVWLKAVNRENYMGRFQDRLDGVLYHTVQFCDNYAYEYTDLKHRLDIPMHDGGDRCHQAV